MKRIRKRSPLIKNYHRPHSQGVKSKEMYIDEKGLDEIQNLWMESQTALKTFLVNEDETKKKSALQKMKDNCDQANNRLTKLSDRSESTDENLLKATAIFEQFEKLVDDAIAFDEKKEFCYHCYSLVTTTEQLKAKSIEQIRELCTMTENGIKKAKVLHRNKKMKRLDIELKLMQDGPKRVEEKVKTESEKDCTDKKVKNEMI